VSEPELKLYDVHLIEQVRVKITRVPAGSAREALEKASRAPLGAVIDRDQMRRASPSLQPWGERRGLA
jgi:hypothetical protein